MTSPLVRLTLFDQDENTTVDNMIASIRTQLPLWQAREGDIETVLAEASAVQVSLLQYTLNQLGQYVLDNLIALDVLPRLAAGSATGRLTFTVATATAGGLKVMPAGTRWRIYNSDGSSLDVLTSYDVLVDPSVESSSVVDVEVDPVNAGSYANSIPLGTEAVLIDVLSWVDGATLTTAFIGGTDAETDAAFYARWVAHRAAQNSTLVLPSHFAAAALGVPGVGRAKVINNWDTSGSTPGTVAGNLTVAVSTAAGAAASGTAKTAVSATLQSQAIAGLQVWTIDPVFKAFVVTTTVQGANGFSSADIQARVTAAVRAYLSPATRDFGATISLNQLIVVIGSVAGVAGVTSVAGTVGGTAIGSYSPGVLDLPSGPATVTVTVT